jgi:hypothetical protein
VYQIYNLISLLYIVIKTFFDYNQADSKNKKTLKLTRALLIVLNQCILEYSFRKISVNTAISKVPKRRN